MQPKETKGTFSGYTKPKKSPLVLSFLRDIRASKKQKTTLTLLKEFQLSH